MSQPIAPRPFEGNEGRQPRLPMTTQKPRKISTACGACKQRKTRCTGTIPCEACAARNSPCIYDASSDQRRKIAAQRNVQDLADTQNDLERHRQLLGGIIATIRAADVTGTNELIRLVRSGSDLSQLAAHVRNELRSNANVQQAYDEINFLIDGPEELPSPTQILGDALSIDPSDS